MRIKQIFFNFAANEHNALSVADKIAVHVKEVGLKDAYTTYNPILGEVSLTFKGSYEAGFLLPPLIQAFNIAIDTQMSQAAKEDIIGLIKGTQNPINIEMSKTENLKVYTTYKK